MKDLRRLLSSGGALYEGDEALVSCLWQQRLHGGDWFHSLRFVSKRKTHFVGPLAPEVLSAVFAFFVAAI